MKVLAIDPGPSKSAWMVYEDGNILEFGLEENELVLSRIISRYANTEHLAIEMVASFGMAVGKETFETVFWIGRFVQAWNGEHTRIYRKEVALHICESTRANDSTIRQALLDRFGKPGTKKNPGPTYGISKDVWSALAIAVTWEETKKNSPPNGEPSSGLVLADWA